VTRRLRPDLIAVLALVGLWLLFFWRLFTPVAGDQASLAKGDFSGQFVAFGSYQYTRFASGQVPLWDPYNNGGLPFIADTQAAVFYPPRLLTIALSRLAGGWSYHALELEMTAHVLVYTLLMYALIRRMTMSQRGSVLGAFAAAIIAGYSGFTAGYPPLQLALLEAAVWLPLGVLGIFEATRARPIRWRWLIVAGFALGLSWMAGHPQTSYFLTLLLTIFMVYRGYGLRLRWQTVLGGFVLLGLVAFGMAAVQLLPGFEYLSQTARAGFEYDAKGNGFPLQDVIQFVVPGVVSVFSPLYVGVVGLVLSLVAVGRRLSTSLFWAVVALFALLWSFGANAALFPLLYNALPGLRFFRGQERAAFLVMNSLAILAGLGAASLRDWDIVKQFRATARLQKGLRWLFIALLFFAGLVVVAWLGRPEDYGSFVGRFVLSAVVVGILFVALPYAVTHPENRLLPWALVGLLVFELFTVSMNADVIYDSVPPGDQLSMTPPDLLAPVVADSAGPFRIDGFRGLGDNYGSLYGIMDMRGISPLFLSGPFALIEPDKINPLAWELFAVRYVPTDWEQLPIASEILATGSDRFGAVNLHKLTDPRPFALLTYQTAIADSDEFARALLHDPNFNPRTTVILDRDPGLDLPDRPPTNADARVTSFAPEALTIDVNTPDNAILSVAQPQYPGWQATIDGQPADILRAYGALSAVAVPAGQHTVSLIYDPLSYRAGAIISLTTWAALAILGVIVLMRRR
jgi:hypothetical protein